MNSNPSIRNQEGTAYSKNYLIIPVIGAFLIILMLFYLNSDHFTLPGIVPWPGSAIGKIAALVGQYILIFLPILLLCAVSLLLSAFLPLFQPIYRAVRQDWSLISFLFYGLSLFMVILQDEYRGLGPYQVVCMAVLGVGAVLYLFPGSPWSRLARLFIALALALGLLGLGIYLLYPQQAWAAHTTFPRWWEAIWPLLVGVSLAVNMVIPALLSYLPKDSNSLL